MQTFVNRILKCYPGTKDEKKERSDFPIFLSPLYRFGTPRPRSNSTQRSNERSLFAQPSLFLLLPLSTVVVAAGETNFLSELYRQTPMRFSLAPPLFHFTTTAAAPAAAAAVAASTASFRPSDRDDHPPGKEEEEHCLLSLSLSPHSPQLSISREKSEVADDVGKRKRERRWMGKKEERLYTIHRRCAFLD